MNTCSPVGRVSIALAVMAGATVFSTTYAAAQEEEGSKSQLTAVTVVGGAEDGTMVKIRYHDLDLMRDGGVKALYHRIKVAAHTVCDQSVPVWAAQRSERMQACLGSAVDAAVVQVGNARLAALHVDKTSSKKGG